MSKHKQESRILRRLRESEELFHIQVEGVKDYAIFMLDQAGNVLNWNVGAERLKGYRAEEIIGRHFSCFYSEEEQNAGKPEDGLKKAAAEGRVEDVGWRFRKDGSRFWADVIITALYDKSGNLRGFSKVTRDITGRKNTEDALRFSEARYRALFRDNPTMIVTLDTEFKMLSVNPSCASQLGYTIAELEGLSVLKLFHEDDRSAVAEQLQLCLQNPNQMNRWQFRKIRKDGALLWVEETAQAMYDLSGALNLLVVCQDVTERKRAEEALRESEDKFSKAFQATPSVLVIASLSDGRYREVNEAFERVIGYRRDEAIDRSSLELNIWQNPEDRTNVLRMLAEGKKVRELEIGFRSKSGTILVCLYSAEIIKIGEERCLLSLLNDITARKKVEEALRKSEKKFLAVFHAVPAILGITTLAEGIFIDVNETCTQILGYQRDEVIGHTSLELGIWESQADRNKAMRTLEEHGKVRDVEINLRGKSGDIFVGLLSAEFIDIEGEQYILSMINDITERKRMEEEIERLNTDLAARAVDLELANRELEAFNYTVAHDLRKPLTVVNGYCQAIKELCDDMLDEVCRDYLREAYEGTLRMNRLIDALLNFSRLAHVETRREKVDLSAMAHEVVSELKLAEPGRRITFRIAEGICAEGDAALLRVVLDNLLGNAWKYTGRLEEAVVEFGMTVIDGMPAYVVRDNGTGFDNADTGKLFIPFQRLPGAEECKGFGIGLATVERIIRRHGGKIWAEGEPEKGATFFFTLQS